MSPDLVLVPIGGPGLRHIGSPDGQARGPPQMVISRSMVLNGDSSNANAYFYSLHSPYPRYYVNSPSGPHLPSARMKDQYSPLGTPSLSVLEQSPDSLCSMGSLSGSDERFKSSKHAESALKTMQSFYAQGKLCDVTLIAGNRRIKAHRLILSAASDYFSAMFTSNVKEAAQEEIELKTTDPDVLLSLVDYCYTGCLELNEDTVEVILTTAQHLLLTEVVTFCCEYMIKQLHPTNCLGIQLFADTQSCANLHRIAMDYTAENFPEVIQNQEFLKLSAEQLAALLSSDDLFVHSEETVYVALVQWLEHDVVNRKKDSAKLLSLIRLPLLSPQFLTDQIESYTQFKGNWECQELIMEAMKYHLLPERRHNLQSVRTRPRKSTVGLLYVVGGMALNKASSNPITKFDLRTNTWSEVAALSSRRLQIGVAATCDKIFVVGGREGLKTVNVFECFDPKSKLWTPLPSMGTHRHGLGVGVLGGPLYAVGGHDGWSYLSSVERWDSQTRQWNYVSQMNCSRSTAGVAVLNGKLYAVGGRDGSSCLNSVECYNPHTNKWSFCSPMGQRRGGVGVVAANGILYAIGGHDAPASNPSSSRFDSVERYDPMTDTWTQVASLLVACDSAGVCFFRNKIYCVGGYDGHTYLNMVQVYDPETNEWTQAAPIPEGRAGACVVMLPNP